MHFSQFCLNKFASFIANSRPVACYALVGGAPEAYSRRRVCVCVCVYVFRTHFSAMAKH